MPVTTPYYLRLTGLVEALQSYQTYINVLKNNLNESRNQAEGYHALVQINLTLQSTLDELLKTTQNHGFAKEGAQGERLHNSGSQSYMRWIAEK